MRRKPNSNTKAINLALQGRSIYRSGAIQQMGDDRFGSLPFRQSAGNCRAKNCNLLRTKRLGDWHSCSEIERKRMAKKRKRKYSRSASRDVESEMRRLQAGHCEKRARRKRWQGQKPEAGNSDRALEGPEKG